jgi:hypothetical protein
MTLISGKPGRVLDLLFVQQVCHTVAIRQKMQDSAGNIFPSWPKSPHFQDTHDEVVQGDLGDCPVECLLRSRGCDISTEGRRSAFGASYGEFIKYFDTL